MKREFKINVREILERVITLKAESEEEAIEKVNEMYENSEIVLNAEDYMDTEITSM